MRIFLVIYFILVSGAMIIALYIMLILISFNPSDPSWLQDNAWNGVVCNIGGILGARISDFLFFTFGILAYIIPVIVFFYLWRFYIKNMYINIFVIFHELLGLLILFFICCGLLNLMVVDNFFYFSSGGIIGSVLCDWVFFCENKIQYYISLLLFLMGLINMFLMFNQSCVAIKKRQLFSFKNILKKFFYKIKEICLQHACYKSCNTSRVCPTVVVTKTYDDCQNLVGSLNQKKYSNVFFDINKFSKQTHSKLQNNYTSKVHINFSNILKKENSIINYSLSHPDVHVHYAQHGLRQGKYIEKNYFRKKIFFQYVNSTQKIHKSNKLYILKNQECKKNNLLQKKSHFSNLVSDDSTILQSISTKENIKQHSDFLKKINIPKKYNYVHNIGLNIGYPNLNLLKASDEDNIIDNVEWKKIAQLLEKKLEEYRIITNVVNIIPGPVITRFELNLSPGIKSSRIVSLSRDLARSLSVISVRVVEIIPGTPYVGLEIPNQKRKTVRLRDIIKSDQFRQINTPLALALGQDISGNPVIEDLRRMPHLLVAGATGSGKSIGLNSMIVSILYKAQPNEVRFIMIDPKLLELSIYSKIPHILNTVITNVKDVDEILQWCVQEMESRYQLMAVLGVRNLEDYNYYIEKLYSEKSKKSNTLNHFNNSFVAQCKKKLEKLPYIVIIIDEFSDLIISGEKKIEELIIRLTQKARASGIHLILATQRPSVKVVTGLIKANIPARIAFTVSSKIDSHTIIGQAGAESLLGMGDMLYLSSSSPIPIRVHGAYIQDQEIYAVVDFWKNQKTYI